MFEPIGRHVVTTETWNPVLASPTAVIDYVDLSSIDNDDKQISDVKRVLGKNAPSRARQLVKEADVLVSTVRPNLNGVAIVPQDLDGATASTGFTVLRANEVTLSARFLYHWVKTPTFVNDIIRKATGQSYPAVSNRIILESLMPVPQIKEQRRIAAILDQAEALRAKRRLALAKLDTLTQSLFLEMFGDPAQNPFDWPIARIGDLLRSCEYGSSSKAGQQGSYAMLRMNNLTSTGRMHLRDLKYIDLPLGREERWLVRSGDILFNRTNSPELVGKTAVFRADQPMAFAGYLVRARVNQKATPEYISTFLNSSFGKATLRGMCKSIIGMANINATEFRNIQIEVPPVALQESFSQKSLAIERSRGESSKNLRVLDNLVSSLQHRAFRGEL